MEKPDEKHLKSQNNSYSASNIQVLEGLEAVRKRPGMYIGDTGVRGLHHLVYEVVDNSIDEALAGHCKKILVIIKKDGCASVEDDGRGIPVDKHSTGKSALEVVLTVLHAGGKFDHSTYKVSGGLHGVGVSVVNALSQTLEAKVERDGKIWLQKYVRGHPQGDVKEIGDSDKTGTVITFMPDAQIFETTEFKFDILSKRLRELAYLNKGVNITLTDERDEKSENYHFEGGISEFVANLNKNKNVLHPIIYFEKESGNVGCDVAIQYNDTFNDNVYPYVNCIHTLEGGTHLAGFKSALTRAVNDYARQNKLIKEGSISGDDLQEGLSAVISTRVPNPQFEGQTKTKLGNTEMKGIVEQIVGDGLRTYFEEHPADARAIALKGVNAMQAREAAQKAKDLIRRKGVLETSVLPGKLADCIESDPAKCELYIVEGDSAGGCFCGETKVALADGRNVSFKQLVNEHKEGKQNYCYTISKSGSIAIARIKNPRLTKKNSSVLKVVLDNGEEIICTPDHKFMLKDGKYKEAKNLCTGTSLMPLYKKLSQKKGRITIKGYEMIFDSQKRGWVFTHLLSDAYNLESGVYSPDSGSHKHHLDFNKLNNNPHNIVRMTPTEHLVLHYSTYEKTLLREDSKQRAREAHKNPKYRKNMCLLMSTPKMKALLSSRAKTQWENPDYKKYMAQKYATFYSENEEYRQKLHRRLDNQQKQYWAVKQNREEQAKRTTEYFSSNISKRAEYSQASKKQWSDPVLFSWRKEKTKEQWTEKFRQKRKAAYNKTYYTHTISQLKKILEEHGSLVNYDEYRKASGNRNLLKFDTFVQRFFNGKVPAAFDAIKHYNHKVVSIIPMVEKIDVYDLEVEKTHNFALASGVFVHNSAKQGRDRKTQAILPLRGKILNVEKASINKILESAEIRNLIMAIGTNFGSDFDISKIRYWRIIIMTDADVDGAHIRTLILTLFYRYLKPLVEQGHIFIAQPPLYKIKAGSRSAYAYDDAELAKLLKEWGNPKNYHTQRYKGLGEMNPQQLWETTMDPSTRAMLKVTVDDAMRADELFTILMGDAVEPRRKFIEDNAKAVKNLDI